MLNRKMFTIVALTWIAFTNPSLAFDIGGVGLGAELHTEDFQDHPTINGINKLMLSFGGEKVRDELDLLFDLFRDIAFTPPFISSQEGLSLSTSDGHKLRSLSFLQNDGHAYVNFRDRIVDDMYVYGFNYVPMRSSTEDNPQLEIRQGKCGGECWAWLGAREGYVPILRGVSLESDDHNDHQITEIQAFIDDENVLRLSFNESGTHWEFKYIVQIAWVEASLFTGIHFEVANEGSAVKGRHNYIRPDGTSDVAVLKGFRFTYVKDEAGGSPDTHYIKEFVIDLENNMVAFNDGDADDYFDYHITYATTW
jgi:hypothetical protein